MLMSPFEAVALLGALCGTAMVVGGIWLVAKGVITLAATPQAVALSIEWKKQFRMNTQVPGLAFFLVGLLFISTSLFFLKPSETLPFELEGELKQLDEPWSVSIRPTSWGLSGTSAGNVNWRIYPDFSYLVYEVSAPGYEPISRSVKMELSNKRLARLGIVELRKQVAKGDIVPNVAAIPFAIAAPTSTLQPAFGEAR